MPKEAELYIWENIGGKFFEGLDAKTFLSELKALGSVDKINLHIASEGGNVFDGIQIYNALRDHPAKIAVRIDGMAASIASVIAMVGDTITMAESSWMMIHEPWTGLVGTAADMRQAANELDMVGDTINRIYSKRTLLESDRVTELMKAETWMTPADAVALGFADSIAEERKIAAHIKHDPTIFPFRRMPEKTPASKPMRNRRVAQMAAQIRKRKH